MKPRHISCTAKPSSGFTLIELMIAVAIVSILVAIAVPMYAKQVQHSRRVDARTAVLDIAGREERYLSLQSSYTTVPANLGYSATAVAFPMTVGSGYYTANVVVVAGAPPNPPTYTASASAIAGTSQAKDTQCQYFSVDSTGRQFSSANVGGGGADTSATCWK